RRLNEAVPPFWIHRLSEVRNAGRLENATRRRIREPDAWSLSCRSILSGKVSSGRNPAASDRDLHCTFRRSRQRMPARSAIENKGQQARIALVKVNLSDASYSNKPTSTPCSDCPPASSTLKVLRPTSC